MFNQDYAERFEADDIPFKLILAKVLPPRQVEGGFPAEAFLIKLKCLVIMRLEAPDDKMNFQKFLKTLEKKRSFCGIWTPELSEPYFYPGEATVELTCYLRQGTEEKILHLDKVARASWEPKRKKDSEDDVLVEEFLTELRKGTSLNDAVRMAEKQTDELFNRSRRAEGEIESAGTAQAIQLESPAERKARAAKPPPGPALGKPIPNQPVIPDAPPAEQPPPRNELLEAPQLASKDRDYELDAHSEVGLDISIDKARKDRKA